MLRMSLILTALLFSLNSSASDGIGLVLINALSQNSSDSDPIDFFCSNYKRETVFSVMISPLHKSVETYQANKSDTGSCRRIDSKRFFTRYPKANAYIEQAWQIISARSENTDYVFEVIFNNARAIDAQGNLTRLQDFISTSVQAKTPKKSSVELVIKGVGKNEGFFESISLDFISQ